MQIACLAILWSILKSIARNGKICNRPWGADIKCQHPRGDYIFWDIKGYIYIDTFNYSMIL